MANGFGGNFNPGFGYGPGSNFQAGMGGQGFGGWGGGMQGFHPGWGAPMQGFNPGMQGFGQGMQGFNPGMQGFGQGMQGFNPGMQGFGQGMQGFNQGMNQGYGPGWGVMAPEAGQGWSTARGTIASSGWGLGGLRRWGGSYSQQYMTSGLPTDEEIEEMIYDAIDDDPLIPWDADIEVRCEAGEVTLSGSVPNKRIKHAAGDDAWWIPGVVDVNNNIKVSGRRRGQPTREERQAAGG